MFISSMTGSSWTMIRHYLGTFCHSFDSLQFILCAAITCYSMNHPSCHAIISNICMLQIVLRLALVRSQLMPPLSVRTRWLQTIRCTVARRQWRTHHLGPVHQLDQAVPMVMMMMVKDCRQQSRRMTWTSVFDIAPSMLPLPLSMLLPPSSSWQERQGLIAL